MLDITNYIINFSIKDFIGAAIVSSIVYTMVIMTIAVVFYSNELEKKHAIKKLITIIIFLGIITALLFQISIFKDHFPF